MLTIENINKLVNQGIWDGWEVRKVYEGNHNNTYILELHRESAWGNGDCTIMLERKGHKLPNKSNLVYFFIYNSQRTDVCATADWLADKDNMIERLEYMIMNKENL